MSKESRIAIFASGNGTNAEMIFRHFKNNPSIGVVLLLTNNPRASVLERAGKSGIPSKVFNREQFSGSDDVLNWLREYQVTHVVLAGFLWLLPSKMVEAFPDRIINIHPALLPKFGGQGMYGMKVHEKVKASREPETGMTIHLVNLHYDEGKILFQAKCPVGANDTPMQIAEKVNLLEHLHYARVIDEWVAGNR